MNRLLFIPTFSYAGFIRRFSLVSYIMYVFSIAGAYGYNSSSVATLASLAIRHGLLSVLLCIALYSWKVLCRC